MNNIEKFRKEQKMSLTSLAKKTALTPGYICHLEKEVRSNPTYSTMKKIAEALDKSIVDVFFSSM